MAGEPYGVAFPDDLGQKNLAASHHGDAPRETTSRSHEPSDEVAEIGRTEHLTEDRGHQGNG